jgi:hypothetical protein
MEKYDFDPYNINEIVELIRQTKEDIRNIEIRRNNIIKHACKNIVSSNMQINLLKCLKIYKYHFHYLFMLNYCNKKILSGVLGDLLGKLRNKLT